MNRLCLLFSSHILHLEYIFPIHSDFAQAACCYYYLTARLQSFVTEFQSNGNMSISGLYDRHCLVLLLFLSEIVYFGWTSFYMDILAIFGYGIWTSRSMVWLFYVSKKKGLKKFLFFLHQWWSVLQKFSAHSQINLIFRQIKPNKASPQRKLISRCILMKSKQHRHLMK